MPHSDNLTKQDIASCKVVAELLAQKKAQTGMNQKVLAKMAKTSDKTISAIVNARMRVPVELAIRLAEALEVHPGKILPALANIKPIDDHSDFVTMIDRLDQENLEVARRMVRKLLDSQED